MILSPSVIIGNVPVSCVNEKSVVPMVEALLIDRHPIHIVTPNPEHIVQARTSKPFSRVMQHADLAIPDGIGLVYAMRWLYPTLAKQHKVNRVTGVDMMIQLCALAEKKGWSIGLIGGNQQVGDRVKTQLTKQFPRLSVFFLGSHKDIHTPQKAEDTQILKNLKQLKVDVVFVAYGAPYQELWIAQHVEAMSTAKVLMGIGGAFDFISGIIKRAPRRVQSWGFEWLYRLFQEPWRWRRQLRLLVFVFMVIKQKMVSSENRTTFIF